MGIMRLFRLKSLVVISLAAITLLLYQNCSTKEAGFNSASNTSSQCTTKMQAANLKSAIASNQLDCTSLINYSCETRKFAESVLNEVIAGNTCIVIDTKEICVPTITRHFNTSAARQIAGVDESEFREGGDFNRQESNCRYFDISKNMNLLRSEDETAGMALNNLVAKCIDAQRLRE